MGSSPHAAPRRRKARGKMQVYERSRERSWGERLAHDYDSQLIESVTVRRNRLTTALLFGENPAQRRWMDPVRLFVLSVALAAVIAAICVGVSFVGNLLQEQRERQEQQNRASAAVSVPVPDWSLSAQAASPAVHTPPGA